MKIILKNVSARFMACYDAIASRDESTTERRSNGKQIKYRSVGGFHFLDSSLGKQMGSRDT